MLWLAFLLCSSALLPVAFADETDDAWNEELQSQNDGSQSESLQGESSDSRDPQESQEADEDSEKTGQDLNDLGEDNLINVQQTPDNSALYDVDIYSLNNADTSYQKNTVQVKGEVVGNAIRAEQNSGKYWITLNSLPNEKEGSISVLVDKESLSLIDTYGSYGKQGTTLVVNGTFYVSCTSHEGIMDIHADSVSLVKQGGISHEDFDIEKFLPGIGLCVLGLCLFILYRMLAEGER